MNTNRCISNNSNLHNNTSAGTVLQAIKGERTAGLLSNNLSLFADVRWLPTTPGLVFSVRKTDQSTTQRLQRLLSFRTSPQKGLHNRTTSPTLSCSCFVDRLRDSTDSPVAGPITLFGPLTIVSLLFSIVLSVSMKFSPGGRSTWNLIVALI